MNNPCHAPAEEALRSPQVISQSQSSHPQSSQPQATPAPEPSVHGLTFDLSALELAASKSSWLQAQHQADAFVNLACDWLRDGAPYLAPDPEHGKLLSRIESLQVPWRSAMVRAIEATSSDDDRECLRQIAEALRVAAQLGQEMVRQSPEQAQRTVLLARLLVPDSRAPFGYFRRAGRNKPLVQCRATDEGGVPLYGDPQEMHDPVVVPSSVQRLRTRVSNRVTAVRQGWTRGYRAIRQAAHKTWHPTTGDEPAVEDINKFA
jgi:hypothetical protein